MNHTTFKINFMFFCALLLIYILLNIYLYISFKFMLHYYTKKNHKKRLNLKGVSSISYSFTYFFFYKYLQRLLFVTTITYILQWMMTSLFITIYELLYVQNFLYYDSLRKNLQFICKKSWEFINKCDLWQRRPTLENEKSSQLLSAYHT